MYRGLGWTSARGDMLYERASPRQFVMRVRLLRSLLTLTPTRAKKLFPAHMYQHDTLYSIYWQKLTPHPRGGTLCKTARVLRFITPYTWHLSHGAWNALMYALKGVA